MTHAIRNTLIVGLAGLAMAACSKAEQADATKDVKDAGNKVAAEVKDATHDITSDEHVQAAANEVDKAADKAGDAAKVAAAEAGNAVKVAGAQASDAAAKAAKDVALDAKVAVHKATEPTPEEKARMGVK